MVRPHELWPSHNLTFIFKTKKLKFIIANKNNIVFHQYNSEISLFIHVKLLLSTYYVTNHVSQPGYNYDKG